MENRVYTNLVEYFGSRANPNVEEKWSIYNGVLNGPNAIQIESVIVKGDRDNAVWFFLTNYPEESLNLIKSLKTLGTADDITSYLVRKFTTEYLYQVQSQPNTLKYYYAILATTDKNNYQFVRLVSSVDKGISDIKDLKQMTSNYHYALIKTVLDSDIAPTLDYFI